MNTNEIKLLVVDDEVAFANTLSQRLNMRNIKAVPVYDGEQALSKLKESIIDVVLLDLKMPGMHGLDVLKKIKSMYPDVQVIILTAHGTDKDEEEARLLGGFDFLKKPADIDNLEQKIRKAYKEKSNIERIKTEAEDNNK
ncbi:MAG: response regulator [Nitrospirae bacterium]|nr:response regulator [Nitrospirota bacterium]